MTMTTASGAARHYLQDAARSLGTSDPYAIREVSSALDESLRLPLGDAAYRLEPPLQSTFAEGRSGQLNLVMSPLGPHAGAADRTLAAARTMEDIVANHHGPEAHRCLKA